MSTWTAAPVAAAVAAPLPDSASAFAAAEFAAVASSASFVRLTSLGSAARTAVAVGTVSVPTVVGQWWGRTHTVPAAAVPTAVGQ